jgi:4-amino-4-deoxy-L-arabinose transferase-like glycosyltransferase
VPVAVLLGGLAAFVAFYRLGAASWLSDELYYRDAAQAYMHGDFSVNRENTMLAKYTVGVVQEVFGSGRIAVRAPAAVAGLLTGFALLAVGKRMAGWTAGLTVFALWCFLPRPEVVGHYDVGRIQIERYFRLEVFLGLFLALALYAAWRWSERGAWRWAVAAGVAVGLSAGSKAPGILVLPAVMLAGLLTQPLGRRSLLQAAAVAAAAALAFLVTYIPLGTDGFDAIHDMFYIDDLRNSTITTPFVFSGHLYANPPWWSNLWWQWQSLGTPAAVSVGLCLLAAPFLLPRRILIVLGVALAVPLVFFLFRLNYALPYYYYAWQPQLLLLCGLTLGAAVERRGLYRVAAALVAVPLMVAAVGTVADVAGTGAQDYKRAAQKFAPTLRDGPVVTWGLEAGHVMRNELPGMQSLLDPEGLTRVSPVVVDPAISERRPAPAIEAYLRRHRSRLELRRVDRLRVYLPRDGLRRP